MTAAVESVQADLASWVGASRVVSDPAACAAWEVDGKVPGCIVYPTSAEQVAGVLRCAAQHSLAVIPCRNGSRLAIGYPACRYDVALSLKEMNNVWHYEPADLTVSVEPGMKLGDFQHFVGRDKLWLPVDPPGETRASLGGILATNSAGPLRLAYGAARDMVLGMKIATTDGKIIKTGGRVVKNVAGYDISKLLVGSFGTLGVIVEASLKLYPLPAERATFVLSVADLASVREFRRRIFGSPLAPARLVFLDAASAALCRSSPLPQPEASLGGPFEILAEAMGSKPVLERFNREFGNLARALHAKLARLEGDEAKSAWGRISDFRISMPAPFSDGVMVKAALPPASLEDFWEAARLEAQGARVSPAGMGLLGLGTGYLWLRAERGTSHIPSAVRKLREVAARLKGTIVVERCPWPLKAQVDVWGALGDDFEIMKKLKRVWDPKGILSPGRFLGGI